MVAVVCRGRSAQGNPLLRGGGKYACMRCGWRYIVYAKSQEDLSRFSLAQVKLQRGVWMSYHFESLEMGLTMSDAIDADMMQESLVVIGRTCKQFKKSVLLRATQERDWQARHRADDVLVCFDAVRYAGRRQRKDLLLLELEQLCHKLALSQDWSHTNRPFDFGAYAQVHEDVCLAQDAIYSALGMFRPCRALVPWLVGQRI
jgi:hypothetical protein